MHPTAEELLFFSIPRQTQTIAPSQVEGKCGVYRCEPEQPVRIISSLTFGANQFEWV